MNDLVVPEVDDFAYSFNHKTGYLWVFGGYLNGLKSNIFFRIDVLKRLIEVITPNTPPSYPDASKVPSQRAASRMIWSPTQQAFYLFGGLSMLNDTLNDMWKFSVASMQWEPVIQRGTIPEPRCGHSFNFHNEKAFLFGGLKEVTQESNETFKFDLAFHTWEEIGSSVERTPTPDRLLENSVIGRGGRVSSTSVSRVETPMKARPGVSCTTLD